MNYLQERAAAGEVVTGLLYVDPASADLHQHLNTVETPLNQLTERELCPGRRRWKSSTPRCASGNAPRGAFPLIEIQYSAIGRRSG